MKIVSKDTGHGFEFEEQEAVIIGDILTPVLCDLPVAERIGAMALQIACACWEECRDQHECLDAVTANVMGAVVSELVRLGFKAQREKLTEEAEAAANGGNEACNA